MAKCKHEQCQCHVDRGPYCGNFCESQAEDEVVAQYPGSYCGCGHPQCAGEGES